MSAKKNLGIEITDRLIRYAEIRRDGQSFSLGRYGEIPLPEGTVEQGSIRNKDRLFKALLLLSGRLGAKEAAVCHLPDQVFLHDLLKEAGFKKTRFESAGEALARLIFPDSALFVYFSGASFDIYAVYSGEARLLSSSVFDSEILKRPQDKEIIFSFLREKIDEQYVSWHIHEDGGKKRARFSKVILAGDLAEGEELAEYLSAGLRMKVQLIEVWKNILPAGKEIPEMTFRESLRFAVAVGLAFSGFEK